MREARFYDRLDDGAIKCGLCPHNCAHIAPGKTGLCRVRQNVDGALISLIWGEVTSVNLDPVEKKPLYHFHPGSNILSIGTWGCNFHCDFCQNWHISQQRVETTSVTPDDVARMAARDGSIGVAYTYNEPGIWFEFVCDCAVKVREAGGKNVLVTNGFINPEPAAEWLPLIDALNIDIKSMDDAFYRKQTGGRLQPVLDAAVQAKKQSHVEITNLVIPTLNDTDDHFERLSRWIVDNLGRDTPLHLSAYFPRFKLKVDPTSPELLERARSICAKRLDHVYLGNVAGAVDTTCSKCGAVLISRSGYRGRPVGLDGGRCAACGAETGIVV